MKQTTAILIAASLALSGWSAGSRADEAPAKPDPQTIEQQHLRAAQEIQRMTELVRAQAQLQAAAAGGAVMQAMPAGKKEIVAYCGIGTSEVTPALASQLKLQPGMGLVVDWVEPKSPAESAGVKLYDILIKFNDQRLVNPEQLRALVRLKKPSDDAKLELIRQGQPATVNVELGQKEVFEVEGAAPMMTPGQPVDVMGWNPNAAGMAQAQTITLGGGDAPPGGGRMMVVNVNGNNRVNWSDGETTLDMDYKGDKVAKLIAHDRAGKETFNGPVETQAQRKALPADLAAKLAQAEGGVPGGINLNIAAAPMTLQVDPQVVGNGNLVFGGPGPNNRPRILTSTDKDTLMLARFEKGKPAYVMAFSTADGKVRFEGPVTTDEQRKALPEAIGKQLEVIEKNQGIASEFGVVGR